MSDKTKTEARFDGIVEMFRATMASAEKTRESVIALSQDLGEKISNLFVAQAHQIERMNTVEKRTESAHERIDRHKQESFHDRRGFGLKEWLAIISAVGAAVVSAIAIYVKGRP